MDDVVRGPRRSRWPWIVGGLLAAFVLACTGIVAWSFIDGSPEDEPAAGQPAPETTADEVDEGGIDVPGDDGEVGQSRRLFTRQIEGGIEVRTFATDNLSAKQVAAMKPDKRPLWCENKGWTESTVITPDAVSFVSMPRQVVTPPRGMYQINSQPSGDDLIVTVAVAAPEDARSVRVAVPGGGVDEMEPVEGIAVLTVLVPGGAADGVGFGGTAVGGFGDAVRPVGRARLDIAVPFPGADFDVTVQIVMADGSAVDVPAPGSPEREWWFPEDARQCQVGNPGGGGVFPEPVPVVVTLPPAGEDQPADPDAARAEIEANHALLYSLGPDEDDQRLAVIDDPTGVLEALGEVRAPGSIMETVDGPVTIEITDLVFTSATEAQFLYTLNAGSFVFEDNRGRARLLDGVWKITRGTYCQDLARASSGCGP